jgi:hypothetical protein
LSIGIFPQQGELKFQAVRKPLSAAFSFLPAILAALAKAKV